MWVIPSARNCSRIANRCVLPAITAYFASCARAEERLARGRAPARYTMRSSGPDPARPGARFRPTFVPSPLAGERRGNDIGQARAAALGPALAEQLDHLAGEEMA